MTISKRESALQGLFLRLQNLTSATVKRNEPLPQKVGAEAIVILRDGDVGEPEILLSPTLYIYHHQAEIEVLVQEADQAQRDAKLDSILQEIGTLISADFTLGNAVDYATVSAPEMVQETIEGAPTLKAAALTVSLEYSTINTLN